MTSVGDKLIFREGGGRVKTTPVVGDSVLISDDKAYTCATPLVGGKVILTDKDGRNNSGCTGIGAPAGAWCTYLGMNSTIVCRFQDLIPTNPGESLVTIYEATSGGIGGVGQIILDPTSYIDPTYYTFGPTAAAETYRFSFIMPDMFKSYCISSNPAAVHNLAAVKLVIGSNTFWLSSIVSLTTGVGYIEGTESLCLGPFP